MKTRDVRVWEIRTNQRAKKRTYTVRWAVAGRPRSQTFATRALADNFRSDLMQAINRGEPFDTDSGLPESMEEAPVGKSWLELLEDYVSVKWPGAAAKTRDAMIDGLATVSSVLVNDFPGRPHVAVLRTAIRQLLRPRHLQPAETTPAVSAAWAWLRRASLPIASLMDPVNTRMALDACALTLEGRPAAATTMRRRRAVFYNALQYAAELDDLPYNPVDKVRVRSRRSKVVHAIDRRVVVSPAQARQLLVAVSYVGSRGDRGGRLVAFFACMYFAALRPGEALGLRHRDCYLPESGWGRLTLETTRPQSGKRWTDSGEAHDERGLKHRGANEYRSVPIPPALVRILQEHVDRFGVGKDGQLFCSLRGNVISASSYSRVWGEARGYALTPAQVDSPLARRPYDLRHAGVSLWLNAGVPAPEVAARAGHSVDVLLKVYAKCIDGQESSVNSRIEGALDEPA